MAFEFLGSDQNTLLYSANRSWGWRYGVGTFLRAEAGFGGRLEERTGLADNLIRGELKFYHVLGSRELVGLPLGKHTLASAFFIDYGADIDRDRQFALGSDNALRGYKSRAFVGDKRLAINLEDRIHMVEDVFYRLLDIGAVIFADVGGASYSNFGELVSNELYADVGVGLRFSFPRSSGGQRVLRLDVAFPLRNGPDGSAAFEPRITFGTGQLFSARLRSEQLGVQNAAVGVGFDR